MLVEVTIPTPGESITEVEIAQWLVKDGDYVEKNQEVAEVESDKATLPIIASHSGKIKILVESGITAKIGIVACTIDTSVTSGAKGKVKAPTSKSEKQPAEISKSESVVEAKEKIQPTNIQPSVAPDVTPAVSTIKATPLARKIMDENHLDIDDIIDGLKKISTHEVNQVLQLNKESLNSDIPAAPKGTRNEQRERMSSLRRKLSQRLVAVKNETAMLTTFNEVDMSAVMVIRNKYQKQFTETHGIKLGFMSFFTKAVSIALQKYTRINSQLNGDEIITPEYVDIAIAVQTDKGLMVPVLRNVESMSLADIEKNLMELATKARNFRLSIEEMSGGTFTITNGGVFGSMLSTPIINPPQSAILGMHNIVERPVAIEGKVEIRPIMYVALSYDHRIIDGRDSVSFLVKVKELIEAPHKMLFGGNDPEKMLLGL